MSNLKDLKNNLSDLTDSDLVKLYQHLLTLPPIKAFRQFEPSGHDDTSDDDPFPDLVLSIIVDVLRAKGIFSFNVTRLKNSGEFNTFREKLIDVKVILYRGLNERLYRNSYRYRRLVQLGVERLYDDLSEMNIPASGRTLMNHIHLLPRALDNAFPGYTECGLLGMIIRAQVLAEGAKTS